MEPEKKWQSTKQYSGRLNKASSEQLNFLSAYMKKNPEICDRANSLQKRLELELMWKMLAQRLNGIGPAFKTVEKWKQAWRDLRNNLKKKEEHKKQQEIFEMGYSDTEQDDTTDLPQDDHTTSVSGSRERLPSLGSLESAGSAAPGPAEAECAGAGRRKNKAARLPDQDPLVAVKSEDIWTLEDCNIDDLGTYEILDSPGVGGGSGGRAGHSALPRDMDPASDADLLIVEESRNDYHSKERQEELHRLKVAEKELILQTHRERLAAAKIERQCRQFERDRLKLEKQVALQEKAWRLKTMRENYVAANLARKRAEHLRDAARLQLKQAHLSQQSTLNHLVHDHKYADIVELEDT